MKRIHSFHTIICNQRTFVYLPYINLYNFNTYYLCLAHYFEIFLPIYLTSSHTKKQIKFFFLFYMKNEVITVVKASKINEDAYKIYKLPKGKINFKIPYDINT